MKKNSTIIGGDPNKKRRKMDFYPTPPEVTMALLDFLQILPHTVIWEPACGDGAMTAVIRDRGYSVIGTDIQSGTDFLTADLPAGVGWIITNPPFALSEDFIKRCIEHGRPFALLLKSQYWHAARRAELFRKHPPAYILPLTWRPDFTGHGNSLMDVMWCVWLPLTAVTCYIPLVKPEEKK